MSNPESRPTGWRGYVTALIARELAVSTRYFDRLVQAVPLPGDDGHLLTAIGDLVQGNPISVDRVGIGDCPSDERLAVLINGNFNHSTDIEGMLKDLRAQISRHGRVFAVAYNPYLYLLYRLLDILGLRQSELPSTFMTRTDLANLCRLSGFDIVSMRAAAFFPWSLFGVGAVLNAVLPTIPLIRRLGYVELITLRPTIADEGRPSLSIIVPARNEYGNITDLLARIPDLNADVEVVFVEGHSTDGTWEEIGRVMDSYDGPLVIKAYQQKGEGKADAVRLGFESAQNELFVVLDADLSVPPEALPRFYEAYRQGHGDFVNGTRLVYPMEDEAMRFLNRIGNVFFAKILSYVLGIRVGDSLCGTKLFPARDYRRMTAWRADFGEFDPFGDFDLIFPAAVLQMGVVDVPVRYHARQYGSTNISRFRHGWMLLKMTGLGWYRIKLRRCS